MSTFYLTIRKARLSDVMPLMRAVMLTGLDFDVHWGPSYDELKERSSDAETIEDLAAIAPATDIEPSGANPPSLEGPTQSLGSDDDEQLVMTWVDDDLNDGGRSG